LSISMYGVDALIIVARWAVVLAQRALILLP
jgi:hypothetical protein